MNITWRYLEYQGPNDGVAPHRGAYWMADAADLDLIARVWHDDELDTWFYDVTEADEIEYNGTPCVRATAAKRDEAQDLAVRYLETV